MQKLAIKGRKELRGKISISGSKNATLPILAASILANHVRIKNIPLVKDIFTMIDLLNFIGLKTKLIKKKNIVEISNKRLGATAVIENDKILGIITDGDIRRMLENHSDWKNFKAVDIMSSDPKIVKFGELASFALKVMQQNNISQVLVVNDGTYIGIVHIHDILKEGLV